ncbi:MAG: caspase family protein [Desulfovibrio sp.]|uniref:caspase family protein n=1 Tax=Desulfovibrio sp. TaxID=885 RepID=UPI0039E58416
MRKALVVGIDAYQESRLFGCVNDSYNVKQVLERNSDGTINFEVEHLTASSGSTDVPKAFLRAKIQELFRGSNEIALLYFAGHGLTESGNGYILASDFQTAGDGILLNEVMSWANRSGARNKIIILDSCFSGLAGTSEENPDFASISNGTTILTASSEDQYAAEVNNSGVFTNLLVDALEGAAGNLVGDVSPGGIYAHIDQSLGAWQQRPVFKTNVKNFVSLRKVQAPIALSELQQIVKFFPTPGFHFQLNPSFEPERSGQEPVDTPAPDPQHCAIFKILQNYRSVNLLTPVDAPHMWHAAMASKTCKLTVLGEHYRRLVQDKRL